MRRTLAIAAMVALLPWRGCTSNEDNGHHGEQASKPAPTSQAARQTIPPGFQPWGPGVPWRALESKQNVSIQLDEDRLKQYGLTRKQVAETIKQHMQELQRRFQQRLELQREFTAGTTARDLLENMVLATVDGRKGVRNLFCGEQEKVPDPFSPRS